MFGQTSKLKKYRVRVGHCEVCVQARDVQEAMTVGRRKLGQELPRLYDVIRALKPIHFQVDYVVVSNSQLPTR
jgi:hypothetical protein